MNTLAYEDMARAQDAHWWFAGRREILRSEILRLGLPPAASILEVGSGTGANLALLAEFGGVTGIEMNEEAIAHARSGLADRQRAVSLRQGLWPQEADRLEHRFDLVCLFDVLEHIADEAAALQAVGRVLKPGGRVLLTVPAYPWLWGPHDEHLHHYRRYTRRSLEEALHAAGLHVERVTHFNTLLFPLACAGRLKERWASRRGSGDQVPAGLLNQVLGTVFASERHLLAQARLPFGLSLLAVARA